MKYLGAYVLAYMGGNTSPSSDDIKKILNSAGVEFEGEVLTKVMSELEGKDVMEVIREGKAKLASVPSGGGASPAAGGAPVAGDAPAEEEKKEESEEEEEEEMDFDLFD